MVSHDPSDIAARGDAEVCRAAVLPLRARRRTGEAGEHRVSEVDRLLSAVGLEFDGPSQRRSRVPSVDALADRWHYPSTGPAVGSSGQAGRPP